MRRPKNVVIVALANKMARTIWALLAHGRAFDQNWGRLPIPDGVLNQRRDSQQVERVTIS